MVKVHYDKKHKVIILEFEGDVNAAQMQRSSVELEKILAKTKRGFTLLTDLSLVKHMSPKVRGAIVKNMELLGQHGVARVIRVIPDPSKDIGLGILSIFHYPKEVKILSLQSREEADEQVKKPYKMPLQKKPTLIEEVRAAQRGERPKPAIAELLKFEIAEVDEGKVKMTMPVNARYGNVIGTLHGGIVCDLADAAMGTAFTTTLEVGESYTTVELKCNFLRPVWETVLTANAWVVSRGKTIGLTECEVRDSEDRLIAKLSSTLMVLRGDAAKGRHLR